MMQPTSFKSSFNFVLQTHPTNIHQNLLEEECKRILSCGEKIEVAELGYGFTHYPCFMRLLLSLYYTLIKKVVRGESSYESIIRQGWVSLPLPISLLKLMAAIIQKKLFIVQEDQQLNEQISYSILFKTSLFPFLLAIASENTAYVSLEKVSHFYMQLASEHFMLSLPLYIYHLYGGGPFTIQAKIFKEKIGQMMQSVAKVLSGSETIINRNIESFKGNRQRSLHLQESLKVVMIAKNKDALIDISNFIANPLFLNREYLQREEFLLHIQSKPIDITLSIFLLLGRSEALLFEENSFRVSLLMRSQISKTNFYTHEMTKLFNKCPFNGDERCDCKKCQCVRRNRESAKLNQEKKRNAVEQVQNFKKRIAELQEREKVQEKRINEIQEKYRFQVNKNRSLEEENLMLKSLLKEMRSNPNIKQLMMQTIQPVSKVLNN